MELEAKEAAKWWAACLRSVRPHDNGDAFQSALSTLVTKSMAPISVEQIAAFEGALKTKIQERCRGHWYPDEPMRGSYLRAIGVDYGPDVILCEAAHDAGFDPAARFPIKTRMIINPGEVRVAEGYGADFETIWKAPPQKEPSDG